MNRSRLYFDFSEKGGTVFYDNIIDISVISCQSVLLVEETGVLGEHHRSTANHWKTLSHNVVSNTPGHEQDSSSQL